MNGEAHGSSKIKTYIFAILIPLAVGGLSSLLTGESMQSYESLIRPPISPPALVFPIVWTILYTLMGISSARVWLLGKPSDQVFYAAQLAANFFWPLFFFNQKAYALSFAWIILLVALVLLMINQFSKVDRLAALLQLPYLFWLLFAGYLAWGVWQLNG